MQRAGSMTDVGDVAIRTVERCLQRRSKRTGFETHFECRGVKVDVCTEVVM